MPKMHDPMRLSPEEERFLRRWMYDEVHYCEGRGPAKQLQLDHHALPAELAVIIAAAMPNVAQQEEAGTACPPADRIVWPWLEGTLAARVAEAREFLAEGTIAS